MCQKDLKETQMENLKEKNQIYDIYLQKNLKKEKENLEKNQ